MDATTVVGAVEVEVRPVSVAFGPELAAQIQTATDRAMLDNPAVFAGATKGAERAGADIADGLAAGGVAGGQRASQGVKAGLDQAGRDAAKSGDGIAAALNEHVKGGLTSFGNLVGFLGLPLGDLGAKFDATSGKAGVFSGSLGAVSAVGAGTVAAIVGISAVAAKMGSDYQTSTAQMAASANIPIAAAKQIGDAFLHSGSDVVFSAAQQEAAYGQVAGQLGAVEGHALGTKDAVGFMKSAMDLAEESGSQLGSTTADLSQVMQTFQIPLAQTATVTTDLFNASRVTNVSVDSLTSTMDRMKARLGAAAPTVADLSTLLVDVSEHGVTGSRGLMVVNTAMNTLLKPSADVGVAQVALKTAFDALPPSLQSLANEYQKGTATSTQVSAATKGLTSTQAELWRQFVTASGTITTATQKVSDLGVHVYNAQGQFVGMGSIIAQLQPKLAGMTEQQQLAALASVFGASANKALLATVLAGPAAYDKAQKSVTDATAAHHALEVQQKTLGHEIEATKVTVENIATSFGIDLLPVVQGALSGFGDFIGFLDEHRDVLYAVAALIGVVLAGSVAVFAINVGQKMVTSVQSAMTSLGKLVGAGRTQAAQAKVDAETNATSAESTQTAFQRAAQVMQQAAQTMQRAAQTMEQALSGVARSAQATAGQVSEAVGQIDASVGGMAAATETDMATADGAWAGVGTASQAAATEVEASDARIEAANATAAESSAGGKLGGVGGKLGTVAAVGAAAYTGYQIGQQITGSQAHPTEIGKAVGSATSSVANFLGVGPQQAAQSEAKRLATPSDVTFLESVASGVYKDARISASDAKSQLHTLGIKGYDTGGFVFGPPGSPELAVVHGGEYILTVEQVAKLAGPGGVAHAAAGTPGGGPSAPGASGGVTIMPGAVTQTFNTPMSAPAVANEVGWALRVAPVSGLKGPR